MARDSFNSTLTTPKGNFIGGMYYYLIDNSNTSSSAVIGNCNAINSVWWSPILDENMLTTQSVDYDVERFGKIQGASLSFVPTLKRVLGINNSEKKLGTFKVYNSTHKPDIGGKRSWKNESRLYNFPYSYALLTDYMNPPMELHYNELVGKNDFDIYAKGFLSDKGTYSLYVKGLQGDWTGALEGLISSAPLDIPVGSSAYSQWSSSQKAQTNQNVKNALMNANVGIASSVVNGVTGTAGNLLSGNIIGGLGSIAGAGLNIYSGMLSKQQAIGNRDAKLKDLSNTPRTMINTGSDVGFSRINGNKRIDLVRYEITEEYKERIGDFFAMYGYKQCKLMSVNTKNRYYYNYVKTIDANINAKSFGIPREHLNKIRSIYDSGVTIWHVGRKGVDIYDYSKDNYEVN